MEFNVGQFLKATGATILNEGKKQPCAGINTDTRTLKKGGLFFALRGPHFDGHAFCKTAVEKGAWGVVVANDYQPMTNDRPSAWLFQVPDTLKALGDIAAWWRRRFSIPVVAITGSNGKTTTKEMTAAILSGRWSVLKTGGNFNNLIGVPLTLNNLEKSHEAAVLEMGMNALGEIRRLTEITGPTVGAVTNAAAAHLEKLQTVERVAQAKAELYETMPSEAVAVYNAEDIWLSRFVAAFKGKKIAFGMRSGCDVRFEHMESAGFDSMELNLSVEGKRLEARLHATGIHNVMNAMCACAIALGVGLPVEQMRRGLEAFKSLKMRFEQIQLSNGVRLVNDAYNANPLSMEAAFRTVGSTRRAGRFLAVLGDMKELGEMAPRLHEETGKKVVEHGAVRLFLIGSFAKNFAAGARKAGLKAGAVSLFENEAALVESLVAEMETGDVVLVKGSRAMRLETVVEALKERFGI